MKNTELKEFWSNLRMSHDMSIYRWSLVAIMENAGIKPEDAPIIIEAIDRWKAEELFVATERNAKLRYEGYKKLSEM